MTGKMGPCMGGAWVVHGRCMDGVAWVVVMVSVEDVVGDGK